MAFGLGILFAILALAVAAVAGFMGVKVDTGLPLSESPIIYGWGLGLVTLLLTAFASQRSKKARFETVVASEVIVVFGITTLVLSIGLGVARTADVWNAASGPPPLDELAPAMRVFAEGFVAAGISPFCAVALRQLDVMARQEHEPVGDVSDELDALRSALGRAAVATNTFANNIKQVADGVQKASESLSTSLSAVGEGGEKAKAALEAAGEAAKASGDKIKPTAEELAKLGASAAEGSVLLDGLRDIIASVEQFVPRGRNGGPP
jgi:methyl-accepting chemotaxis protein